MPAKYKLVLRKDMRKDAVEVMKRSLGKGEVVQVGELGNFQLQFGSTGAATKKEFNQSQIKSKRIVFRPGKLLRGALSNYAFERIPDPSETTEEGGEDRPEIN